MIGYLSGKVIFSNANTVLLKTSAGVGWEIYYKGLAEIGIEKEFYISQIFRENSQELFAFDNWEEKELFEFLLDVNGVGPKSAYSLLTNLGIKALVNAILLENKKALQSAPGIGPKAAAQLILSLKDKLKKWSMATITVPAQKKNVVEVVHNHQHFIQEVLMACSELGFQEVMVMNKAQEILETAQIQSSEELLKLLLSELR